MADTFHGLKLSVILAIAVSCFIIISLIIILLCLRNRSSKRHRMVAKTTSSLSPMITKDITEVVKPLDSFQSDQLQKGQILDLKNQVKRFDFKEDDHNKMMIVKKDSLESSDSYASPSSQCSSSFLQEVLIGWGRWYTYRELEIATNGFSPQNVIGEGGYGVVYRGLLPDNSLIAVKNLFNNRGQAEQEFKVEVEAIGKVRHKNLVGLIGYCVEGAERMLIYEYISNGNLEQWLHGDAGRVSPLTWDVRMKIAVGTAKGIAYLHEGLEPKVVHRDIKSSNILLDKKWNPKVSDFGLAKLLGSNASHVTTRVMGTFGCVAPEYASSGRLKESSDVYSFGVLLMEIISGRSPVDYAKPSGEVNLVDWFKMMVANRRGEEVLDPRIEIQPSLRTLKRIFLVCLRCIDWDADKRPKMGQVVHMLEADDFPFRSEYWIGRDSANLSPHAAPVSTDDTPFLSRSIAGR